MTLRIIKKIDMKNNFVIPIEYQMNLVSGLTLWEQEKDRYQSLKTVEIFQEVQQNRWLRKYLAFKIFLQDLSLYFIFLSPKSKQKILDRKKVYENVKDNLFIIADKDD